VATVVERLARGQVGVQPIVDPDGLVDLAVVAELQQGASRAILADALAQADVVIEIGQGVGDAFERAPNGRIVAELRAPPEEGQRQEAVPIDPVFVQVARPFNPYTIKIILNNPYTFRAAAISNVTGLLVAIGLFALGLSMIVAAGLASRFTTPLRRLTEATRSLAEGNLSRRVPLTQIVGGSSELTELGQSFNLMAERLEESVSTIRRDRDRSRDFLADVSHELRTPIAALRTFNELLKDRAGDDPEARSEFLESSGQQIDRLDWLAQNLLELSKLDSGLVLLDLRPDDLRATVESAVEQAEATAQRRAIRLTVTVPHAPLRIQHDPLRIGQVVTNLVNNALKFTPRGGSVEVQVRPHPSGAQIEVRDTGVGIDAAELPRIFERFYRGSRANEARGSGSGLGLAIVRSIVDMHAGQVSVESRLGAGSTFTVTLPRDPRAEADEPRPTPPTAAQRDDGGRPALSPNVVDSSPADPSRLNPGTSP
jgi:signal transduction histidine kinase